MHFQQTTIHKFYDCNNDPADRLEPDCAKSPHAKYKLLHNSKYNLITITTTKHVFLLQLFLIVLCFYPSISGSDNFIYSPNSCVLLAVEFDDNEDNMFDNNLPDDNLLANPMEKYFNKNQKQSQSQTKSQSQNFPQTSAFADRTIMPPKPQTLQTPQTKNYALKNINKQHNKIKLTSTAADQDNNTTNENPNPQHTETSDPFNAQAPPNSQFITPSEQQNYAQNNYPNNYANNYSDNNQYQNSQQYYQPQNYTQLDQFYQQYNQQYSPQYNPQYNSQYYPQYAPQFSPQYTPQYTPQYYPYFYGMYSPYNYSQNFDPYNSYNSYAPENFYGQPNTPNTLNQTAPQSNLTQRNDLFEPEALRELERARREAAEAARLEAEWTPKPPQPILYPILSKLWSCVTTLSPFNTPTGPDRGVGMPLRNGSWLDRPYYFGGFIGKMNGSELVSNMIDQSKGANGGLVLGYNMNEYWGLEGRLHFASIDIKETANGAAQYALWFAAQQKNTNNQSGASTYMPNLTTRSNQLTVLDLSVHYYPLGNAKFRPYFKYGLGFARESFYDTFGKKRTAETLSMPFGFGLRYWWNKQFAFHADVVDNVIFSHDIVKTQNNWALTIGLTYSFGNNNKRRPIVHWPYTPSSGSRR
ncbi:MAG: outer membrane beta-barrel protein [Planctomycetaceae bacterium]|jgi:hypothetical protein|nr:outer membrane beta-barrel protein [Planctomycetaceae bacterium]